MKIRMRTTSADGSGTMEAGKVYEVPKDKAQQMITFGNAEAVGGSETTSTKSPETTTRRLGQRKTKSPTKKKSTKKKTTKKRKTKRKRSA